MTPLITLLLRICSNQPLQCHHQLQFLRQTFHTFLDMDHHQNHHHTPTNTMMVHEEPVSEDHMGHTGQHMSMSPAMDHMMMMYFHGGFNEVILFDFWRISSLGGLIGSMIGCFILGILYEGIKSYREYWMRGAFQTVRYNHVSITASNVSPMIH